LRDRARVSMWALIVHAHVDAEVRIERIFTWNLRLFVCVMWETLCKEARLLGPGSWSNRSNRFQGPFWTRYSCPSRGQGI